MEGYEWSDREDYFSIGAGSWRDMNEVTAYTTLSGRVLVRVWLWVK